jgi:hypothetical protein
MARYFSSTLVLAAVALIVVAGSIEVKRDVNVNPVEPLRPLGFQGKLAIPEEKFLPVIEAARSEMDKRYNRASELYLWRRVATWSSLGVTCLLTLVGGVLGQKVSKIRDSEVSIEGVYGAQIRSAATIRLISLLLALVTIAGLIAQQLESEQAEASRIARELNEKLRTTVRELYDPRTSLPEAQLRLAELQESVAKKW